MIFFGEKIRLDQEEELKAQIRTFQADCDKLATKFAASKAENAENKAVVDQAPQSKIVEGGRARGKLLLREICDHIEDKAPRELVEDTAIANDDLFEAANMLTAKEGHVDNNTIDSLLVMGTISQETTEQAHDQSQRLISRIRTQFHILVIRKNKWFRIARIIASNEGLRGFTEEEDRIIEAEHAIYEGDESGEMDNEDEDTCMLRSWVTMKRLIATRVV